MNDGWIGTTDRLPDFKGYRRIWTWDGKAIDWHYQSSYGNTFFTHWRPLVEPEPPKKKEHRCDSSCGHFACALRGDLLWLTGHNLPFTRVKICPFCGYKAEAS